MALPNLPFSNLRQILSLALIARAFGALRDYRRSLDELDALSDHDLRDLGIGRDAIAAVAWDEARRTCAIDKTRDASAPPQRAVLAPVLVTR